MVLISLAILFAAIGALSLTGSGDSEEAAAPEATSEVAEATSPAAQAPAASTTSAPTTSVAPAEVEVRVLNNSDVSGLAATTADTLTAQGWTIAETGNYAQTQVPATTVYYGDASGAEAAAQEIAGQLGATAEAMLATLTGFGDSVVVMVTQ